MGTFRLLGKREVDAKKAQERQRELDEGGKLARTVDSLRELRASEEMKFTEWRDGQLASISKEIKELESNLPPLRQDVLELEERKREALRPLNEHWGKLAIAQQENESVKEWIAQQKAILQMGIAANIQRERKNEDETERIREERKRSVEELVSAHKSREDAEQYKKSSEAKIEKELGTLAEKNVRVAERERLANDLIWKANQIMENATALESTFVGREHALKVGWQSLEKTKKMLDEQAKLYVKSIDSNP